MGEPAVARNGAWGGTARDKPCRSLGLRVASGDFILPLWTFGGTVAKFPPTHLTVSFHTFLIELRLPLGATLFLSGTA